MVCPFQITHSIRWNSQVEFETHGSFSADFKAAINETGSIPNLPLEARAVMATAQTPAERPNPVILCVMESTVVIWGL